LTCGDDNTIYEFSISKKQMIKQGKVWTAELFGGKPYETTKIKSTASTMSSHPSQQQARAVTYSKKWNHVAVSNNFGDVTILDYDDFSKKITTIHKPKEWCEVLVYSPNEEYLAIGSHDDAIYIYKIADGKYNHHWSIVNIHTSAITAMDWSRDSKYLRAVDQAYAKQFYNVEECTP
jgi:WD40 repeat protein